PGAEGAAGGVGRAEFRGRARLRGRAANAVARGREHFKRYRIQAAGANLALLLRHVGGIGTLKQSWAASQRALLALLRLIQIPLGRLLITLRRTNPPPWHWLTAAVHLPRSARDEPPYSRSSTVC